MTESQRRSFQKFFNRVFAKESAACKRSGSVMRHLRPVCEQSDSGSSLERYDSEWKRFHKPQGTGATRTIP